jgi:hypothetical protein
MEASGKCFSDETFAKRPFLAPAIGGTAGSNFNPRNMGLIIVLPKN